MDVPVFNNPSILMDIKVILAICLQQSIFYSNPICAHILVLDENCLVEFIDFKINGKNNSVSENLI